ncbi:MAG: ribulose-phosphate 3-epimerase [Bacteroidetes bacterium]|nr:ribulose-phosphate 3-epimerase [Bacteroidota bacterium]
MTLIAPSVLAADFSRLGDEIADTVKAGADQLHLDIMDGHFVPNISYGPSVVKTVNSLTDLPLDVHLMLTNPEDFFEAFIKAGADAITFHIEVHPNPVSHLDKLHEMGVEAGLSLNPDKAVDLVLPYLEKCDRLLVMSVFPGFGGQKFIESTLTTIEKARTFIDRHGLKTVIAVDGGVDGTNATRVVVAGADILVMGSAFYRHDNRAGLVREVHALGRP